MINAWFFYPRKDGFQPIQWKVCFHWLDAIEHHFSIETFIKIKMALIQKFENVEIQETVESVKTQKPQQIQETQETRETQKAQGTQETHELQDEDDLQNLKEDQGLD